MSSHQEKLINAVTNSVVDSMANAAAPNTTSTRTSDASTMAANDDTAAGHAGWLDELTDFPPLRSSPPATAPAPLVLKDDDEIPLLCLDSSNALPSRSMCPAPRGINISGLLAKSLPGYEHAAKKSLARRLRERALKSDLDLCSTAANPGCNPFNSDKTDTNTSEQHYRVKAAWDAYTSEQKLRDDALLKYNAWHSTPIDHERKLKMSDNEKRGYAKSIAEDVQTACRNVEKAAARLDQALEESRKLQEQLEQREQNQLLLQLQYAGGESKGKREGKGKGKEVASDQVQSQQHPNEKGEDGRSKDKGKGKEKEDKGKGVVAKDQSSHPDPEEVEYEKNLVARMRALIRVGREDPDDPSTYRGNISYEEKKRRATAASSYSSYYSSLPPSPNGSRMARMRSWFGSGIGRASTSASAAHSSAAALVGASSSSAASSSTAVATSRDGVSVHSADYFYKYYTLLEEDEKGWRKEMEWSGLQ
ncbi:hypothetical protein F5Y16DRAFT_424611 [Xylariaceae sp. FL0255]|nr:hypothetical protein F5Y16DRAFT_424611 [Xylariaceae sp. FL0255]